MRRWARAIVATSGLAVAGLLAPTLLAQEAFSDPAALKDPFAPDGAPPSPADAAAPGDPTLGPDPFATPASPTSPAPSPTPTSSPTPASATTPISDPPPIATLLPPTRKESEDDDALVFGGRAAKIQLTLLLQPQLAWEFFSAAASPNADADGSLPPGVGANDTFGQPDGSTSNRGTFRLRRARIGLELTTDSPLAAALEIDPNLADIHNPRSGSIARRFELMGRSREQTPSYEVGAGLFTIPFSRDLAERHHERIFVERSAGSRAMFPEDADLGVRFRRIVVPIGLTFDLAAINGVTVGEPTFGRAPDLNKTKDVTARIALKLPSFEAGLGGYAGQGQAVDPQSRRVQQRSRAAIALDALFRVRLVRGWPETRFLGEVVVGRNLDRGVLYPFVTTLPADTNVGLPNFDSRSAWLRLEQDFRGGTIGFRYDAYTPDATDPDNTRHTLAFAVARAIGRHARVMLEFDHVVDNVHAPATPTRERVTEIVSATAQLRY